MMFWYGPGTGTGMGGWGYGLMMIGMLAFWGLLLFAVVLLVRYAVRASSHRRAASRPAPETLLAERFASGDIDAETYRHDLAELRQPASLRPRGSAVSGAGAGSGRGGRGARRGCGRPGRCSRRGVSAAG